MSDLVSIVTRDLFLLFQSCVLFSSRCSYLCSPPLPGIIGSLSFAQLTTPAVSLVCTKFAIFSGRGICRIHRICIGARYEIYLVRCSKYTRLILDAENLAWLRTAIASLSDRSSNRPSYRILISIRRHCSYVK